MLVVFSLHQVFPWVIRQEWQEPMGLCRVIQCLEFLQEVCLVTIQAECRIQVRIQFNLELKHLHLHHLEQEILLHNFWLDRVP